VPAPAVEAEKPKSSADDLEKEREEQRAKEAEQLEEEMRKRRERVKQWQEAKAAAAAAAAAEAAAAAGGSGGESTSSSSSSSSSSSLSSSSSTTSAAATAEGNGSSAASAMDVDGATATDQQQQEEEEAPKRRWTLEDDEDEDDTGDNSSNSSSAMVIEEPSHPPPNLQRPLSAAAEEDAFLIMPSPGRRRASSMSKSERLLGAVILAPSPSPKASLAPSTATVVAQTTSSSSSSVAAIDSSNNNRGVDDDEDPLESFMSSLYENGDVEAQRDILIPSSSSSSSSSNGGNYGSSAAGGGSPRGGGGGGGGSASEDEEDVYSMMVAGTSKKVNPFGSNFITLEDLNRKIQSDSGWESDVGPSSPLGETEEEKDAREEQERREFVEAIRRARENEEKASAARVVAEEVAEKEKASLGRVYAHDGDVMDESELDEKKKSALEVLEDQKKGKELKPLDHSTIEYMPFRKNLYIVPRLLARMTEEEIKEKRDVLQIKVRGKGCPSPVDSWEQCGLSERVLQIIQKHNLEAPFAIQKQALPAIMCGRDVIGVAKTGSGKTLAFLLPMFRHIQDQPPLRDGDGPIGLVMAPMRELAFQIHNEAKKFTKGLGLRVACVYGGAGVADQIADLKRGAEIVVCTPGRMIDILCMQAGKLINLKRVTLVVMDEADRMFDMGFEPQIKMILQNTRPDRQTVLFSATFPKQIEKLAKSVLRLPLEISVGEQGTVNKDITQLVEVHEEHDKFLRLLQLLGIWYERGSVLIFVDKQEKCDQLFHDLLKSGYPCLSLHGGKDQVDRDHTLHEFKTLIKTVMIATSVAGRGLDVPEIVCVVNYSCPNHMEEYVHRVGRTGRAGRKGTAYTFISPQEDQYAPILIKALNRAQQTPPAELLDMKKDFVAKVERGEAKWVSSESGFIGKGFTFDAEEMNESQKNASMQRRQYELEEGIQADIDDDGGDDDDEDDEGGKGGVSRNKSNAAAPVSATITALEKATSIAAAICTVRGLPVGGALVPLDPKVALAKAKQIAAQLMASRPSGTVIIGDGKGGPALGPGLAALGSSGDDAGEGGAGKNVHYTDELDINDYPSAARRKVTQKNGLDDVLERTGVNVIVRGVFTPPSTGGKAATAAEKANRLHFIIEGPSEIQVKQARLEILRILEEETLRIGASGGGGGGGGRYSVI